MNRPTFFLSSTIYDFSDLRSAIKYFLEQQGCIVLASEFNDFNKSLDEHSYHACLDAIAKADYYVLLIGSRVGGWFDENKKISITQQEYKTAYELHKKGKLKIINFVRDRVWQLKEDRLALSQYLNQLEINDELKQQIKNHPTKALSDAEFIINFINEVGKNQETKEALSHNEPLPTGNWIHTFSNFNEIIDVLQTQIFLGQPIEAAALKKLLHKELIDILRTTLCKFPQGLICSPKTTIDKLYEEHKITLDVKNSEQIRINTQRWMLISTLAMQLLARKINPLILTQALTSTVFTTFDFQTSTIKEEPVYEALFLLESEIRSFNQSNNAETLSVVFENSRKERGSDLSKKTIDINTYKLFSLLHLFFRWINIIDLTTAIIKYLDGNEFIMPKLKPKSPIPEMNSEIDAETVTIDEANKFIYTSN